MPGLLRGGFLYLGSDEHRNHPIVQYIYQLRSKGAENTRSIFLIFMLLRAPEAVALVSRKG